MPYSDISQLPRNVVKSLPMEAKESFMKGANEAMAEGFDTTTALAAGWAEVRKDGWAKEEGHWVHKSDGHDTLWIGLWVPEEAADLVALEGVDGAEPMEDLHLTLVMCGRASELPATTIAKAKFIAQEIAQEWSQVNGEVSGVGRFNTSDGEERTDVIYASFDAPGLSELREDLVRRLRAVGVPVQTNHGFDPHITLAYVDGNTDVTLTGDIPVIPITFPDLVVRVGDSESAYPFGAAGEAREDDDGPSITIVKADEAEDQRLVFGWLSVAKDESGNLIVDNQGDIIYPEDLEKAAYNYALYARDAGEMHKRVGVGKMVESMIFTKEKQEAMGIPSGTLPECAWWVGFRVDDPTVWDKVKKGEYRAFSIGGSAIREAIEVHKADDTEDIEKHMQGKHDQKLHGRRYGAGGHVLPSGTKKHYHVNAKGRAGYKATGKAPEGKRVYDPKLDPKHPDNAKEEPKDKPKSLAELDLDAPPPKKKLTVDEMVDKAKAYAQHGPKATDDLDDDTHEAVKDIFPVTGGNLNAKQLWENKQALLEGKGNNLPHKGWNETDKKWMEADSGKAVNGLNAKQMAENKKAIDEGKPVPHPPAFINEADDLYAHAQASIGAANKTKFHQAFITPAIKAKVKAEMVAQGKALSDDQIKANKEAIDAGKPMPHKPKTPSEKKALVEYAQQTHNLSAGDAMNQFLYAKTPKAPKSGASLKETADNAAAKAKVPPQEAKAAAQIKPSHTLEQKKMIEEVASGKKLPNEVDPKTITPAAVQTLHAAFKEKFPNAHEAKDIEAFKANYIDHKPALQHSQKEELYNQLTRGGKATLPPHATEADKMELYLKAKNYGKGSSLGMSFSDWKAQHIEIAEAPKATKGKKAKASKPGEPITTSIDANKTIKHTSTITAQKEKAFWDDELNFGTWGQGHQYAAPKLAARLKDDPDWKDLVDDGIKNGHYTNAEGAAKHLLSIWSGTSADTNSMAILAQKAAQEEFGLGGASTSHFHHNEAGVAHLKPGMRKFLRAQYEETQEYFASKGITHVTVYRGASDTVKSTVDAVTSAKVTLQPMSSFSTDYGTAAGFAGSHGHVISAVVPVERIIGCARTGYGTTTEKEMVLLGAPKEPDIFHASPTKGYKTGSGIMKEFVSHAKKLKGGKAS